MDNYNNGFYNPDNSQGAGGNNGYSAGDPQYQLNQYGQGNQYAGGGYNNGSYNQGMPQNNGYYNNGNMYNNPGGGAYNNQYGGNGYHGESAGLGIASMVLGIVSVVLMCWPYISIPTAIVGLILGALGSKKTAGRGMAIAGLVCSLITLAIDIIILATGASILSNLGVL